MWNIPVGESWTELHTADCSFPHEIRRLPPKVGGSKNAKCGEAHIPRTWAGCDLMNTRVCANRM